MNEICLAFKNCVTVRTAASGGFLVDADFKHILGTLHIATKMVLVCICSLRSTVSLNTLILPSTTLVQSSREKSKQTYFIYASHI